MDDLRYYLDPDRRMIWQTRFDPEALGFLPEFVSSLDERPSVEQLNEGYAHGGGWNKFEGMTLTQDEHGFYALNYPGDPAYTEIARTLLRDETIVLFQHSWVAVIAPSGGYEVARMD